LSFFEPGCLSVLELVERTFSGGFDRLSRRSSSVVVRQAQPSFFLGRGSTGSAVVLPRSWFDRLGLSFLEPGYL